MKTATTSQGDPHPTTSPSTHCLIRAPTASTTSQGHPTTLPPPASHSPVGNTPAQRPLAERCKGQQHTIGRTSQFEIKSLAQLENGRNCDSRRSATACLTFPPVDWLHASHTSILIMTIKEGHSSSAAQEHQLTSITPPPASIPPVLLCPAVMISQQEDVRLANSLKHRDTC
jgi:hypothetical protein